MTGKSQLIKELYPDIDWVKFEEIDHALNFDLWYGTASEYFCGDVPAETLEHYAWEGYEKASRDIEEILSPLPHELWYDLDGGEIVTDKDPEDYDGYWSYRCTYCEEWLITEDDGKSWQDDTGGDCCSGNDELENENETHKPNYDTADWRGGEWEKFNVRQALMHTETFRQVF